MYIYLCMLRSAPKSLTKKKYKIKRHKIAEYTRFGNVRTKVQKKKFEEKFPIPLMHHVPRKKIGSVMHGEHI